MSASLAGFVEQWEQEIGDAVVRAYPPLYDAEARRTSPFDLRRLGRRPLGVQADAVRAVALSLQRHRGTILVGEMGAGKSGIAAAAAYLAGYRQVLLFCPPHLVRKWRREIEQTVPLARVAIVRRISELERARHLGGPISFVVLSREQAKLGYRWQPAAVPRLVRSDTGAAGRDETGAPLRQLACPACFAPITDDEGVPLGRDELATRRRYCARCAGPLWQADRTGPHRYPLADYVLRHLPGHFDLLIVDEVHEEKSRGAAQGLAAATLAEACGRSLVLTGTLLGGYASTLFHILYRFSPGIRAEFGHGDEARWVARYGFVERITKKDPEERREDGRHSRRRTYPTRIVERPGVTPPILFHLLGNTVFLRLRDVASNLPPFEERVVLVPLDQGNGDPEQPSQAACYGRLESALKDAVRRALVAGSRRLLGAYLQALLAWPDACTREEVVVDPLHSEIVGRAPALPADRLYPKEQQLVELISAARARSRRVLGYVSHTGTRDLTPRLRAVLEREGFRVAVLKADTVAPDRREEWVDARVREGVDVLLTNPRLVATGLDLVAFPELVFVETDYSTYTLRRAARRSWRIGQHQPVTVSHLVYEQTMQAEALALVAAKLRASLAVEGELPEDGLAALEGDGADVVLALARRLAQPAAAAEARSLEALFAEARQQEVADDALLTTDDWHALADEVGGALAPSDLPFEATRCGADEAGLLADLPLFALASVTAAVDPSPDGAPGRVLRLEDLARLGMRLRPRTRRPVSTDQLGLFGA